MGIGIVDSANKNNADALGVGPTVVDSNIASKGKSQKTKKGTADTGMVQISSRIQQRNSRKFA